MRRLGTISVGFLLIVAGFVFSRAGAQQNDTSAQAPAKDALAQNFQAEHEIGRRFHFDPADLPAPKAGPIVTDRWSFLTTVKHRRYLPDLVQRRL
jgi:hypothetical protein